MTEPDIYEVYTSLHTAETKTRGYLNNLQGIYRWTNAIEHLFVDGDVHRAAAYTEPGTVLRETLVALERDLAVFHYRVNYESAEPALAEYVALRDRLAAAITATAQQIMQLS